MTEAEWLNCGDVSTLLGQVRGEYSRRDVPGRAGERKLRLFACACCRRIWPLLTDSRSREAVVTGERIADGKANRQEAARAWRASANAHDEAFGDWDGDWATLTDPAVPATLAASTTVVGAETQWDEHTPYVPDADEVAADCVRAVAVAHGAAAGQAEVAAQVALFHDVVANPFRPVALDRSALPDNVIQLARVIYAEHAFDRMPELAETLETAGCTDADVLAHCRGPGPHVRGCWVVDLILGKA